MSAPILETRSMTVAYGGVTANDNVSVRVEAGSFVGLIGPNGAGKTTFIDAVSGFTTPRSGSILLKGAPIDDRTPAMRARAGIARTFQSLELFDDLPVIENLMITAETPRWWKVFLDVIRPRASAADLKVAEEALALVGLSECRDELPQSLSHGQRKLVGVARALAAQPDLLLLDEPAAGLDPSEVEAFSQQMRSLVGPDRAVLLVDHNMSLVLNACDYVYVLDFGRMLAHGTPDEVMSNPDVIAAYLGSEADPSRPQASPESMNS